MFKIDSFDLFLDSEAGYGKDGLVMISDDRTGSLHTRGSSIPSALFLGHRLGVELRTFRTQRG